ncbi:MAG: patatin-like phospholipase family protein, partial [Deltaproteobacteria bacterium]|nr:patatin-like phospholipase family protein [Deltaproteobacteria bacterium]
AWIAVPLTITVLDRAEERFNVHYHAPVWFWDWAIFLYAIPPTVLILDVACHSAVSSYPGILGGVLLAWIGSVIVDAFARALHGPPAPPTPLRFIFYPDSYPPAIQAIFQGHLRWLQVLFRFLRRFGPGYTFENNQHQIYPYPEHVVAAAAVFLVMVVYVIGFLSGWHRLAAGKGLTGVPALADLEFLITLLAILFSGAAFYFDRYRIPVTLATALYLIGVSAFFKTDHYWNALTPAQAYSQPPFPDGLSEWLKNAGSPNGGAVLRADGKPVIIVVCASGGGIEAAAWTARVLTGLQERIGNGDQERGAQFARSIRLISSTSGGSVGSLFYVQSLFEKGTRLSKEELEAIFTAAKLPSLDAVGWGFTTSDFARMWFPFLRPIWLILGPGYDVWDIDRGWALEQAWRVSLRGPHGSPPIRSRLSDWRKAVAQGRIPGTVFNATVTETGRPLLLSTVDLDMPDPSVMFGADTNDRGADINTVTAARLSASFPYVSPVTRERYCRGNDTWFGPHIADGGYYDNYGVTAAIRWIHHSLDTHLKQIGKVIIIGIDDAPEQDNSKLLRVSGGWSSEIIGPAKTAVNALFGAQKGRNDIELDLLLAWSAEKKGVSDPNCHRTFWFHAYHAGPLSWQLSDEQANDIQRDWLRPETQNLVDQLVACLQS